MTGSSPKVVQTCQRSDQFFLRTLPQYGQVWLGLCLRVFGTMSLYPASSALVVSRDNSSPGAMPRADRFSPAFCRTFLPGSSSVPRVEAVQTQVRQ